MTEVEPDSGTASVTSGGASAVGPVGCGGGNGDGDDVYRENHLVAANRSECELGDDAGAQDVQEDDVVGTPPAFDPLSFSVDWSTSVDWVWVSSDHSVTHTTGAGFDSSIETESNEFEYTLDETGEYLYHCGHHRQQGQVGAIDVE